MNLAAPFIGRPVATTLTMVAVVLVGAFAYLRLPIASLPNVDRPTIVIHAPLPGGNPSIVGSSLAQPLERQIGLIPGVVEMTSWSGVGATEITVQFDLSKNIDEASGAVQAAINAASPDMPKAYAWPPYFYRANPAGFAVMSLALTSDVISPSQLYDFAYSVVSPKLSQLAGVAWVNINGAEHSAVRVQVSPNQAANMNLSLEAIRAGIVNATQNLPKGSVEFQNQSLTVEANDQLLKASEYRDLIVAWRNGSPIRLGDVADVSDSVINRKVEGWYNHDRGVVLYVFKQSDANVVETVDAIKQLLPGIKALLPPSVRIDPVYDRTALIRESISEVQRTILIAIVLVVLVLAIFLKQIWAAVIPTLTIPVALAATLAVMRVNGYSLDNLTLMALVIAVGFVVDDAVIVIENIMRRMDAGESAMQAALAGSRQMGFTIVSITAALAAAMIPLLFMPDVVGRYLREFGVALVAAIAASAFVSLSLTPVLCSRLLGGEPGRSRSGGPGAMVGRIYGRSIHFALRWRGVVFLAIALLTAASVWLYMMTPRAFMPTQDTGVMFVRTVADPNISFPAMEAKQRAVIDRVLEDEAVAGLSSWIADGNGGALSLGSMIVALKPLDQRKMDIQKVIARLKASTSSIKGIRSIFVPFQDLSIGTQSQTARYQYTLWGANSSKVFDAANEMFDRMRSLPQLTDLIRSWETSGLGAGLTVDRLRAAYHGVTPTTIDSVLNDAFSQRQINTLYLRSNFSRVILEIDPEAQTDPAVFQQIFVPGRTGQVPLSTLTRMRRAHASMWVRHSMQFPSETISFDTRPEVSLGDAIDAIKAAEFAARLPEDVKAEFRGEAGEAAKMGGRQTALFALALVAIYIVLGMLYESYAHPLTILSVLPPTAFGALLALRVTGLQFTTISSIACILVVGMVMKNAIMMVDFALDAQRSRGLSPTEAITLAARLRARPILMTMLVSTFSALPLAIGTGPGAELRQPIGVTVVGGLIAAQLVTLYTTPVMYLLMEALSEKLSSGRKLIGAQA